MIFIENNSTEQRIIQAALHQYSNHGYYGSTMRNIAKGSGLKSGSIYFFFHNKEELFLEAFKHLLQKHQNKMDEVFEESKHQPLDIFLTSLLSNIVQYHKKDIEGTQVYISLLSSPVAKIDITVKQHMEAYNEWLKKSIREIIEKDFYQLSNADIDLIIEQYTVIGNGIFWGINLYDDDTLKFQVQTGTNLIMESIHKLNKTN